jgi:small subunit ribosomal protein S14
MSYSNYEKAFKQLQAKPSKLKKYIKHNAPKKRSCGLAKKRCTLCGRIRAHISSYGLHMCRQCFRDNATSIGFKKYS